MNKNTAKASKKKGGTPSFSDWSYYYSVDEIFHAQWAAQKYAKLARFREAFDHFWPKPRGHPTKLIQVAGTSGKGSTCQFIQAGLSLYGKSACYVKPHVFDYSERFVIDNKRVDHAEIVEMWEDRIRPYCIGRARGKENQALDHPEASLLIALSLFEKHHVKWAAVETGLGGRYDPVTALPVVATVLTNIGRDHEDVLGSEHWQRALEKSGISRKGIPFVLGDDNPETVEVVEAVCADVGAPLQLVGNSDIEAVQGAIKSAYMGELNLGSDHQTRNAAVAAKVVRLFKKDADLVSLCDKFARTEYIGRFWMIRPQVYVDVAHNPSKTEALASEIGRVFGGDQIVFVIGISGDRDPVEVVRPLLAQAKAVLVTAAGYKGQDPARVEAALRKSFPRLTVEKVPKPQDALAAAMVHATSIEIVIFTGSTYMIDQALNPDPRMRHLNGSYGWRLEDRRAQQPDLDEAQETAKRPGKTPRQDDDIE